MAGWRHGASAQESEGGPRHRPVQQGRKTRLFRSARLQPAASPRGNRRPLLLRLEQRFDLFAQIRFQIVEERLLALVLRSQDTLPINECQQGHHGQLTGGMNKV